MPRKPSMPSMLERSLIGSSSTWRQDELKRFKVDIGDSIIEVKGGLIPEKWFDFVGLQHCQKSNFGPGYSNLLTCSARSIKLYSRG